MCAGDPARTTYVGACRGAASGDRDGRGGGDLADLPAGLPALGEGRVNRGGSLRRDREEQASRRLRLEEESDETVGHGRVDGEQAARTQGGVQIPPVALHAPAPLPLLGQRERARQERQIGGPDGETRA